MARSPRRLDPFVLFLIPSLFAFAAFFGPEAHAANGGISFELLGGVSEFHLSAGSVYQDRDGGFGLEFRPQINLEVSSFNSSFTIFYQGREGSNFGAFPISRTGFGVQYYPVGMPIQSTLLDNGVSVNENRFVPFISASLCLSVVAITDPSGSIPSFNGLTFGYQLGAGAEIPVTTTVSAIGELMLENTLTGGSSGSTSSVISLSAYALLLGVSVHL